MGGSLTGWGNLAASLERTRELRKTRELNQQKLQAPATEQERNRIAGNNLSMVMLPHLLMANKKLLIDQKQDKSFQWKYTKTLASYQGRARGAGGTLMQQLFFNPGKDQTTRDLNRYFNIAGRFYGMQLPALTAGTGMRAGQFTSEIFDPHIPDYNRSPKQTWDRALAIYPGMLARHKQDIGDTLTGGWARHNFALTSQANHQFNKLYSPQEYKMLSPGIFKYGDKLSRGAIEKLGPDGKLASYEDVDTGQQFSPQLVDPTVGVPAGELEQMRRPTPIIPRGAGAPMPNMGPPTRSAPNSDVDFPLPPTYPTKFDFSGRFKKYQDSTGATYFLDPGSNQWHKN